LDLNIIDKILNYAIIFLHGVASVFVFLYCRHDQDNPYTMFLGDSFL